MHKENLNREQTEENYSYSDLFFEKGHWFLKIKQLLIALLGWSCFIVPTFITIASFLYAISKGKYGIAFWKYYEGVFEIKFLLILLAFCVVITFTYAASMTIIQNN